MVKHHQLYISISGNTASGKSTFLKTLQGDSFFQRRGFTMVDESSLHHPLLPQLFHATKEYGFQLQLNFMLQRHLTVRHVLDSGSSLVMERCHLDDRIFIDHLKRYRLINASDYRAYLELWHCLDRRLRLPDIVVYFKMPATASLRRLAEAEASSKRPKEFASEAQKRHWVRSWAELYEQHFKLYRALQK